MLAGPRDKSPEPAADVSDAAPADAAADAAPEAAADAPDDSSPAGTATAPAADAPAPDQEDTPVTVDAPPAQLAAGPDPRCAEAVEQARAAAVDVAGTAVGDHLGVEVEDVPATGGRLVTHSFATTDPAYVGWRWAVTVARSEGSDVVTVDEVVLLPGGGALSRRPGCRGASASSPATSAPATCCPRRRTTRGSSRRTPTSTPSACRSTCTARWASAGCACCPATAASTRPSAGTTGSPARTRRWPRARPAPCGTCGFLTPLAGALGRVFGACANGMAPDDGRVVALTHGCGAHSETVVETQESSYAGMVVELEEIEMVENSTGDAPAELAGGLADDAEAPAVPARDTGDAPAEPAGGLADDEAPAAAEDAPQDAPQDTHGAPAELAGTQAPGEPEVF